MKNIITLIIFLSTLFSLHSLKAGQMRCSPQLKESVDKIYNIPEAKNLIEKILSEGDLQIIAKNTPVSNQFGAYWDRDNRAICISLHKDTSIDLVIGSILFELHNAAVNKKFDEIDNLAIAGKINKKKYVESMEYIEFVNSLDTASLAEKGIQIGAIPEGSKLYTYDTFKEYFEAQLMSGHSDCFADCYDDIIRYSR